jgi:hypothetical protein
MSVLYAVAQAVADHLDIWAAPEPTGTPQPGGGGVNTAGILGWFAQYIVPVILGGVAVITIGRAARGNISQTMTTSVIVLIGVVMFGAAGVLLLFGDNIVNVIFS